MRFSQLDSITQLEPGKSIVASRILTGHEHYLADHFPNFPCMPGVLVLEAMYQAGAWLLRQSDGFERPIVMLKEVSNVKYGSFVAPGHELTVAVNLMKQVDEHTYKLKGSGTVDGKTAASGVMLLDQFSLAQRYPERGTMDGMARREYLKVFRQLFQPATVETA